MAAASLRRIGAIAATTTAATIIFTMPSQSFSSNDRVSDAIQARIADPNIIVPNRTVHRSSLVDATAENPLDVLVIGGGATGCGVALDAVTRGLRVGLVEREDFASGTSSRSTKLVHGGLFLAFVCFLCFLYFFE